jgi:resuscitation-promoting factor RpfA
MRLVCPNCDAKYEVPEDAIPETGRDVQCANCGHAWYQMRPRAAEPVATAVAAAVMAPPPVAAPVAAPVVETVAAPVPEPVVEAVPDPVPEPTMEAGFGGPMIEPIDQPEAAVESPVDTALSAAVGNIAELPEAAAAVEAIAAGETALGNLAEAPDADVAAVAPMAEAVAEIGDAVLQGPEGVADVVTDAVPAVAADGGAATGLDEEDDIDAASDDVPASVGMVAAAGVAAYAVDESVLAILREEAEREAQARKAEAAKPLETQTDLGIDSAMAAPRKAPDPAPADRVSGDEVVDDRMANRRTRLPDVEEINSTLRPSDAVEAAEMAAVAPVEARSGFRSGFLMVLTVAILGSAIYSSAGAISQAVPALEGPLKSYVSFIDSLRLKLDGLMQSATVAINGT